MSKFQRHLTIAREDCEEMKYMQRELATVDRYLPKQEKRQILCYIGHDLHGHFDPNHVDFELLCGIVHTEKAAIFLPPIVGILIFLSLVLFTVTGLYYFIPFVLVNVPFLALLYVAIRKRSHKMMVPFLIYAILEKLVWIGTILFLAITVFNPHLPAYVLVKYVCNTQWIQLQMAVLLIVLIFSMDLFIMLYLDYNILFHYVYLYHSNTSCCQHTHDCPGKGDVDPFWHGRTSDHSSCGEQCPHTKTDAQPGIELKV